MKQLDIDIQNACGGAGIPPQDDIRRWVSAAIGDRLAQAEVSLRIVDEAEITALNTTYRNQAKATNVLSFPAELATELALPLLGDLVICAAVVEREAAAQHKHIDAHWAHMVVHGTLHLLGYDHTDDREADTMEALETDILASLHYQNPYITQPTQEDSTQTHERRPI